MRWLLAGCAVAAAILWVGFEAGRITEARQFERDQAWAMSLCQNGIPAYHKGDWFCFSENMNVKQWRPRWTRAVVVMPEE